MSWVKGRPLTVLEVGGAEGLVSDTISWMASRSLSRCRALLMPTSRWISVSDKADMMAPLLTLARQAATYQAGIPTQSCREGGRPLSPGPGAGHHRKARPGLTHGVRRANAEQDSEAGTRLTASARFPLYNDLGPRKVRPAGGGQTAREILAQR